MSRAAIPGALPSAGLSRRVEKLVGYPPLCDMDDFQRRELHEALVVLPREVVSAADG
jgi:hypothetical protein